MSTPPAQADGRRVTIYHNPACSTSVHATKVASELGVDAEIVLYLKSPPDATTLRSLIDRLDGPAGDLVRRDATWARLGLTDDDVRTGDQVVDVLVRHPQLLQRPLLVVDGRAVIGRPKDRVRELLS